jgi:hypothetical protein
MLGRIRHLKRMWNHEFPRHVHGIRLMWQYFKGENRVIWEVDLVKSRRPVDPGCVSYSQVRNELAANDWPSSSRI